MKTTTLLALTVLLTTSAIAEEMVELKLVLPKPSWGVNGPKNIKTENLERKRVVPKIMVPLGTKNIAAKIKVTSSDNLLTIGKLKQITDGKKGESDDCCVEIESGLQWIQIDLGTKKTIYAIILWHYHAQPRVYYDVIVQVADDAKFTKNVRTLFNNDHDNSAKLGAGKNKEYVETYQGKLIDAKGVKARFVRLYSAGSTGSDMNHYIEVEVFGK